MERSGSGRCSIVLSNSIINQYNIAGRSEGNVQRRAWFGLIQCNVTAVLSLACGYNAVLGSVSFNATPLQSTALRVSTTPCLVWSHSMPHHGSPHPCVWVQHRAWFGLIQCHITAVHSLACEYNAMLGLVSFNATSRQSTPLRVGTTPCLVRSHSMPHHGSPEPCGCDTTPCLIRSYSMPYHCSPHPCVWVQHRAWFGLIQCHVTAVYRLACGYNAVLGSISFNATSRQSTSLRVGTTPCLIRSHSRPHHGSPQPCVWVQRRAWFGLIQCHSTAVHSLACEYNAVLGSVSFNATALQSTALRVRYNAVLGSVSFNATSRQSRAMRVRYNAVLDSVSFNATALKSTALRVSTMVWSHSMPHHCSPHPCVWVQRRAWFGLIQCHITAVHSLAGALQRRAWFGLIQCHVSAVLNPACGYNAVLGLVSFNAMSLQSTSLRVGTTPRLVRSHSMPHHGSPQPCV